MTRECEMKEKKKKKRNFYIPLIRFTSIKIMDNLRKINSIRRNKQKSWCVKTSIGLHFSSYAYNLILEQERLYVGNRLIQAALSWSMGRLPMYRRFYYNYYSNDYSYYLRVILNTCLIEIFYMKYLTLRYKKNYCIENQE